MSASDRPSTRAVDHLGMKVPTQALVAELIDFTTTQTYRPRYFSFLCWAWSEFMRRRARRDADGWRWSDSAFNAWMKRQEWWVLVASRLDDASAPRLRGLTKADWVLSTEPEEIHLVTDFLRASTGSLGDYRSSLRHLGLIHADDGGDEVPTEVGDALAEAFRRCVAQAGFLPYIEADTQPVERLRAYGAACALHRLDDPTETRLLRLCFEQSPRRRAQLALLLRLHAVPDFRRAVYLGVHSYGPDEQGWPLELAPVHDKALDRWWLFSARENITFGLEAMLLGARMLLAPLEVAHQNTLDALLDAAVTVYRDYDDPLYPLDAPSSAAALAVADRHVWPTGHASQSGSLGPRFPGENWPDDPDWLWTDWDEAETCITWGFDILLGTALRWRALRRQDPERFSWPDVVPHARTPLDRVLEYLEMKGSPTDVFRAVLRDLVIQQHLDTTFRKLLAQPKIDSARLVVEDGRLWNTTLAFGPTVSASRIAQARAFLVDLGWLSDGKLTADGESLATAFEAQA